MLASSFRLRSADLRLARAGRMGDANAGVRSAFDQTGPLRAQQFTTCANYSREPRSPLLVARVAVRALRARYVLSVPRRICAAVPFVQQP
eukprot:4771465-Pleurochrysis_carterae.AAC.3